MSPLEGEKMQTQYDVLSYRIYLYFHVYKLAIEIDENGNSGRNIDNEKKRQNAVEQELDSKYFRTNPEQENWHFYNCSWNI